MYLNIHYIWKRLRILSKEYIKVLVALILSFVEPKLCANIILDLNTIILFYFSLLMVLFIFSQYYNI